MRRGAVMLEVLLSVALFVGAAAFCLGATRSMMTALDRADRRHRALDIARSKLAELEAGLIALQDLRGQWDGGVGSHQAEVDFEQADVQQTAWTLDVETSLTEFRGLTLVALTVAQAGTADDAVSVTLRRLMTLRDTGVEEYEADDLLEGLPLEAEP